MEGTELASRSRESPSVTLGARVSLLGDPTDGFWVQRQAPPGVLPTSCPSLCWGQEPGEGAGTTPQRKKHLSTWGPAWWLGILLQPNLVARKEERGGSQGLSLVHRLFRKREHNKYTDPFLKKKKKSVLNASFP